MESNSNLENSNTPITDYHSLLNGITEVGSDAFLNLSRFVDFLLSENQKHNLIGKSTEENIWHRHIMDSAQIIQHIGDNKNIIITDFGSGAGFPGIVLSILGISNINLIEVREKKVKFLNDAKKFSDNKINVIRNRIEDIKPFESDIITARALAPLDKLLTLTHPFLKKSKYALFFKGKTAEEEIAIAQKMFKFNYQLIPSITSEESFIVKIWL